MTSNKTITPSKAYWNNLDPGSIPDEIQALTQAEQRLLCRIIPLVKIVKFTGLYGQYGFRGQAVLLPKISLRSVKDYLICFQDLPARWVSL